MLGSAARCGCGDEVFAVSDPDSEADPVAILLQYLACFGNAVGHGPFYLIEGDRDRKSVVEGKSGDLGGGRIIIQNGQTKKPQALSRTAPKDGQKLDRAGSVVASW